MAKSGKTKRQTDGIVYKAYILNELKPKAKSGYELYRMFLDDKAKIGEWSALKWGKMNKQWIIGQAPDTHTYIPDRPNPNRNYQREASNIAREMRRKIENDSKEI